jgi:hypothetical protein
MNNKIKEYYCQLMSERENNIALYFLKNGYFFNTGFTKIFNFLMPNFNTFAASLFSPSHTTPPNYKLW